MSWAVGDVKADRATYPRLGRRKGGPGPAPARHVCFIAVTGSVNAGQGMAKMSRYSQMQQGRTGSETETREGFARCKPQEMRLKV